MAVTSTPNPSPSIAQVPTDCTAALVSSDPRPVEWFVLFTLQHNFVPSEIKMYKIGRHNNKTHFHDKKNKSRRKRRNWQFLLNSAYNDLNLKERICTVVDNGLKFLSCCLESIFYTFPDCGNCFCLWIFEGGIVGRHQKAKSCINPGSAVVTDHRQESHFLFIFFVTLLEHDFQNPQRFLRTYKKNFTLSFPTTGKENYF